MKKLIYMMAILSFITLPSVCFAPPMYYGAVPQDETYSAANLNGDTKRAVSQDDFYDYLHNFDADDDGSFADETWLTGAYQPLEATLTDIADGTITEDLVNTANPWADNEVADTLTIDASSTVATAALGTVVDTCFIPIDTMISGTTAPGAAEIISSTNKAVIRNFSSSQNEDVFYNWQVPHDFTGSTIKYRVVGYITSSTAPAASEGVSFFLQGASIGTGDALGATLGTAIESAEDDLNGAGAATQYDIFFTSWSGEVTVTSITAGETALLKLYEDVSDSDDDYGQDKGIAGIEIKYQTDKTASY